MLLVVLAGAPDAAAHTIHHAHPPAGPVVEFGCQGTATGHGLVADPAGPHQRHSGGGAGHAGSCCVAGCSTAGIAAEPLGASCLIRSEPVLPVPVIDRKALALPPPHRPPRFFS